LEYPCNIGLRWGRVGGSGDAGTGSPVDLKRYASGL
jgi:hypothetical protein